MRPKCHPGYSGPIVSFEGNFAAQVLTNAFYYNIQDILDKIDKEGVYHTSTKDALSWGGYKSIGTFRKNLGRYYGDIFSRDMGRSLQEITMLGYTDDSSYAVPIITLRKALQWETDSSLKVNDMFLPSHWGMYVNKHNKGSFENDGHGLTTLFIYKLWQRLPNRDEWLRSHWQEIKGSGDWILWQFDHPEISGAANGLLHTTGESANGKRLFGLIPIAFVWTPFRRWHKWRNPLVKQTLPGNGAGVPTKCVKQFQKNYIGKRSKNMAGYGRFNMQAGRTMEPYLDL